MQDNPDRSDARPGGDSASSDSTGPSPERPRLERASGPEVDPVVEAYKRDIDRTLLRENLRRSVTERVANLIALQRLAEEARRAGGVLRNKP